MPPCDDRHVNDLRPILKSRSDVLLLGGWDEPTYLLLWFYGVITGRKVLFWIESTAHEGVRKGGKEAFKRLLLKHAAGCIVPGKRALEYCSNLGVPEERIFIAPNATDRDYFCQRARMLQSKRPTVRKGLGIQGVGILFVGRLVEDYKGVADLISAFGKLTVSGLNVSLMMVGDGTDKPDYENMVKRQRIPRVHFLGELGHEELCQVYAAADIFVLPSRSEPWGFVLNEGMEFGLPLVVSEAVGAGPDLVHPGENGFIFPVGDSDALAKYLEILVRDESLRKRMGERSKEIIKDFSPEAWAQGVVKAIESVTGKTVNSQ